VDQGELGSIWLFQYSVSANSRNATTIIGWHGYSSLATQLFQLPLNVITVFVAYTLLSMHGV